jgi:hypothetical protein
MKKLTEIEEAETPVHMRHAIRRNKLLFISPKAEDVEFKFRDRDDSKSYYSDLSNGFSTFIQDLIEHNNLEFRCKIFHTFVSSEIRDQFFHSKFWEAQNKLYWDLQRDTDESIRQIYFNDAPVFLALGDALSFFFTQDIQVHTPDLSLPGYPPKVGFMHPAHIYSPFANLRISFSNEVFGSYWNKRRIQNLTAIGNWIANRND